MEAVRVSKETFKRYYVWEFPVRIFHWVNAASILILVITGLLIGTPPNIVSSSEAYRQFWFGWIRFIHFTTGYVLLINFSMRIYWGVFAGNKYANWRNFFPITKEQQKELKEVLLVDIFQLHKQGKVNLGHNALASISYLALFFMVAFQIVSGFALYSGMSDMWFPKIFSFVPFLFGSDFNLRFIHHFLTWLFVAFTIIHVYITFYHDYVEGCGTISSIIGGWKFEKNDPNNK